MEADFRILFEKLLTSLNSCSTLGHRYFFSPSFQFATNTSLGIVLVASAQKQNAAVPGGVEGRTLKSRDHSSP
jgi:hypothetical protein